MLDEMFSNFRVELKKINEKLDILQKNENLELEILSTNEIMSILKINRNQANDLFKRADFPRIRGIKSNKIERVAFAKWLRNEGGEQ